MKARQSILIVEDELVNRKILRRLLRDTYDVVEAENGQIAFEIILSGQYSFAAILLDLVMPVTNGYEFMALMAKRGISNIPILVMTGEKDAVSERKALEAGAWDFIGKPYDSLILDIRLKNAIARSQVELYKKLNHMAEHDTLTGLYNRGKLFAEAKAMIAENPDLRFLFLRGDIDRFHADRRAH